MPINVSLEEMLEEGLHFGHQARRWNPKIAPYLYGKKDGVYIFDLLKTREDLIKALEFLKKTASQGQTILLVGTKKQAKEIVATIAREVGVPYVTQRWLGGTLTNFEQIRKSVKNMIKMREERTSGEYRDLTKKERLLIDRKIERLEYFFSGVETMEKLPEVIFILDTHREHAAVSEARRTGVAIVGVVDTNSDPTLVDWPIPANDDSEKAVKFIVNLVGEAIKGGKKAISNKQDAIGNRKKKKDEK